MRSDTPCSTRFGEEITHEAPASAPESSAGTSRTTRLAGPVRIDDDTERRQSRGRLLGDVGFALRDVERHRHEEPLAVNDGFLAARGFESFVGDAFVRGVHVDDHEPVRILCQDVDTVQLPNGKAEGRNRAFVRGLWTQFEICRVRFADARFANVRLANARLAHVVRRPRREREQRLQRRTLLEHRSVRERPRRRNFCRLCNLGAIVPQKAVKVPKTKSCTCRFHGNAPRAWSDAR